MISTLALINVQAESRPLLRKSSSDGCGRVSLWLTNAR